MEKRKALSKKVRFEVFERDRFTCQYCGRTPIEDGVILQADHIVSVKNGGNNDIENLTTSCWDCNIGKGAKTTIKRGNTPEELKKQLEQSKERLEQVVAMNLAMKQIVRVKKRIDEEKYEWVKDVIGERYNQPIYTGIQKIFESRTFSHLSHAKRTEALEIISERHRNQPLEKVDEWLSYLRGILKNLDLTQEERDVLRQYSFFFKSHSTPIYAPTRQMILGTSYWGVEYHKVLVNGIDERLKDLVGKRVKANESAYETTGIEMYIPYKRGAGLNYFVCDIIGLKILKENE